MHTNYLNENYNNCNHKFERDLIDIDPDRSKVVYNCIYCGFMTTNSPQLHHDTEIKIIQTPKLNLIDPLQIDDDYTIGNSPIPCTRKSHYERQVENVNDEKNNEKWCKNMLEILEKKSTNLVKTKPRRWREIISDYIRRLTNIIRCIPNSPKSTSITTQPITPTQSPEIEVNSMSGYSSISSRSSHKDDIKSIHIEEDIRELSNVSFEHTMPFTPTIKYGKVLKVCSPREIVIASRIYNGYTKLLKPNLYRFHVTLSNIPYFGVKDREAKEKLIAMILNKIVIIENLHTNPESQIMFADIYLADLHVNMLLYDSVIES